VSTASAGPLRTFAAVLIGTVVLTLLGQRTATPNAASSLGPSDAVSGHTPVVATVVWQQPAPDHGPGTITATGPAAALPSATAQAVVVRAPVNGVHDSLYRLARDTLDNPDRWPEIFALNEGAPQPGGHRLTVPSLIYPGEELRLPAGAHPYAPGSLTAPAQPAPASSPGSAPPTGSAHPPTSTTPPTSTPPAASSTTTPVPSTGARAPGTAASTPTAAPPAGSSAPPSGRQSGGLQLGTEIFLGLGLAAAISAALMLARYRYRRGYQPGSGRRDDLPVAPVVYQLRLAHLRATRPDPDDDLDGNVDEPDPTGREQTGPREPATPLIVTSRRPGADDLPDDAGAAAPRVGIRDGRDIALDLACTHGLGLVGDGTPAAARALLLALLAPPPPPRTHSTASAPARGATVLVPAADLAVLLGASRAGADLPDTVRVVTDLDAALDEAEAEILRRTREHQHHTNHDISNGTGIGSDSREPTWPPIAIVATPPDYAPQRLQAVLDNGATVGVLGVLLGQWRPGVTAYVTAYGRISATSPGLGEPLRGTRVFRLPEPDTADLLALLHRAQPEHHDRSSARDHLGTDATAHHTDAGTNADGVLELAALATGGATGGLEITGAPPARGPSPTIRTRTLPPPSRSTPPVQAPPSAGPRRHEDRARGTARPDTTHNTTNITTHADDHRQAGGPPRGEYTPAAASGPQTTDAGDTSAETTRPAAAPIGLAVLGPVRLHWHPGTASDPAGNSQEITAAVGPRQRELLVFLAVHRDGVTRDTLVAALWPDGRPDRPTNALNAILGRLRRALATATGGAVSDILIAGDGRYHLDPALVEVDLWHFADAVTAQRAATTEADRIAAYRRVVAAYDGKLAEGTNAEWLEAEADATRRDALDAVAALARAMVQHDPAQTLELLETARTRDPYNELLYRDIMRLQDRLGRHDAIGRTLTQLTKRLAEINDTPSHHAVELATRLQARHATAADPQGAPVSPGGSPRTGPASPRGPRVTHPAAGPHHGDAPHR
jgi:DNA-binding SARP family transcriptional activator